MTVQEILDGAACLSCLDDRTLAQVETGALKILSKTTKTVGQIMDESGCISCQDDRTLDTLYTGLLDIMVDQPVPDLRWGNSASQILNSSGAMALPYGGSSPTIPTSLNFAAVAIGSWQHLLWRNDWPVPRAYDGFFSGVWPVDMAGAPEGFGSVANGWSYQPITIYGVAYKLFRMRWSVGGGLIVNLNF